jgi:PD-(D/E)XK endonuclease
MSGRGPRGPLFTELIRRGYSVLVPWGVNQRYDLVLDLGHEFVRAQCKTGRSYRGEAELFLVYCPENGRVSAVPVEEAPANCMHLRVSTPLNGQARRVRWASEYELPG